MCLGIPGRVVQSAPPEPGALRMGLVEEQATATRQMMGLPS